MKDGKNNPDPKIFKNLEDPKTKLLIESLKEGLEAEMRAAELIKNTCDKLVGIICPYKKGDIITIPERSYSHKGKKMLIDNIFIPPNYLRPLVIRRAIIWILTGPVLKNNGEPSQFRGEVKSYDLTDKREEALEIGQIDL